MLGWVALKLAVHRASGTLGYQVGPGFITALDLGL
jgi:hypothetical protein